MKGFKKKHLTAEDCEALMRSAEGLSSLMQPLSQRQSRGDVNRGLHPTHRTRRHKGGQGQQKNITDYFRISQIQQVGAGGTKNSRIQEEQLDPIFTECDDSFSNVSTVMETSGDSSSFLEDEDLVPAHTQSSRKRPLSAAAAGVRNPEHDLWGEPEKKPMVVHPEHSQIKQEHSQIKQEHSQIKQELDNMEIEPVPDAHYGLLGTRNWEVPQGNIEDLPVEILSNIFAFLPVTDLYRNLSLVCHRWREIISSPLFIPWKKLYHRYLMKEDTALHRVEQVLQDFAITKEQKECVLGLIRCVSAIPTSQKVNPSAVLQCLQSHHLFSKAEVCVANKLPHLQSKTGPENMWAIIAVMVLFSDGVSDIQRLMACLQTPCSTLSVVDVTETLYCIATLLYAMREKDIVITNRIHYNIFYCLYLMENSSVTMPTVEEETLVSQCRQDLWSSSLPEVTLTLEQQKILNHKIERGHVVKIIAFAGTGKTSTLAKYAEKFADLNFLYVAFNKAVVERARSVFPRNVTCKTFHSLAYESVGKHYKEKGKLNFSKMSAYSMSFLIQNHEGQSLFIRGKTVSQTLENFFASSHKEICAEHTPIWFKNTHGERKTVSQNEKEINVEEAKEIWHNMKKLDGDAEKKYKITSDGYLKLWQLSKPQLSGYDAIFVDEAQDCTPAIMDIVLSQTCGIILVGDPHQQIYAFRGAVSSLYSVRHTHVYYLTKSFRFGPEIAYVGATILDVCKRIRSKTLVGGNQKGDVRGSMEGKIAILSRSNFNVFEDAVKLTGRQRDIKIHVIGGTSLLTDSNRVHQGKEGTMYFLVVDNAVSEDGGVYTCVAKNAGGEVLCKAELIIHEAKKDQAAKKVATRRKLHSLYEVKQEIGRGCFSFVKRVVHKGNRVSCAAKFIPLRSKTKARAHQERDILASLSHDRITRLLDQFETRKTLILVLELCSSEELLDRLFKKSVVTEAEVKLYIRQILEGIKYLHDNNILHLDIKPLNILMVYAEREDLKLCDFGFAQKITPFEPQFSKYGSPEFVAPEIVSQSPVSKATDIWAVGVITYLSLTCKSPFAGENDRGTLLNIQNGEISWTIPDFVHLSEDAKDFMKGILQQNPKARPSALDCLSHKWFMHNLPLEAAHFINTKQLKFIVARSKWQRSLMCYKSILVMRSIPEILERTHDNTSLAISRHLIEESTSSSTSGSSSDNENSHFPKKRHFGSTPELHLSIFDAPSYQEPSKHASEENHSKISVPPVKPMRRKYASMKAEVGDKSPTESKELMASILKEKEEEVYPRLQDETTEQPQRSSAAEPSSVRTSTEGTSHLCQKEKTDVFLSDKDRMEKAGDGTEKPPVCVPRQSVIKSTFYSQAAELPARGPSSPGREFRRHLDRARRTFRKAGYSKVPISGLREPLLEQFELEEEEGKSDDRDDHRESLLGSLTKSASFDTARKPPHPAIAGASRSRSLDDYRLRTSRSVREQDILEEDSDILSQESCPEGSDHCDISAGPGKGCSVDASKQEDFRRDSKDCSDEQPPPSTQCEGNGCQGVFVQQLKRLPVSPHRSENRKHLLKKSKATYVEEEAEDLEGKSPVLTAQCSDVTALSAQKHESTEAKSSHGSASGIAFQVGKESISTLTQSETPSKSAPTSKGDVCLPQEPACSTDIHPDLKGGSLLIKRTAPVPPWKDKRQKHSHEKNSAHSVAKSDLVEHESSAVLTGPQTETDSLPVCKDKGQELLGQSVPPTAALVGKQRGTLTALHTADEGAHQKLKTYKEVRPAVLEDEGLGITGIAPPSAHDGETQAHKRAPVHVDTASAILKGEHLVVPEVPPPKSMPTSVSDGARQAEREQPAHSKKRLAALRGESSAVTEIVPSLAHKAEIEGAEPQKVSEGGAMVHAVPESRHPDRTVSSQNTGLPSVCEREKQEYPKASLRSEVRSVVTASGSRAAGQTMPAPFPKTGHQVLEQHRAAYPSGRVSADLEGGPLDVLTASQPEVPPASAYELEYEEHARVYGEGRGVALESGSCDAGKAVPPSLRRDQNQELSHHRSSFYSDEESAVLEGLVDEMVSLSEEMNVWAESVSGEEECRKHISPPTEMYYKGQGSQAPMDTSFPSLQGGKRGEVSELDDLAEPHLVVSEESVILEGQGAQTIPHECEHLEDLAFESATSSQVSVSSTDSLDTGKRPSQVSVSKDTGKHPEVSLVKIKDLSDETPSLGSGTPKLDISEVEPAYLNFSDLYDIVYFPFEFMNYRKPQPKPTGRRFIAFGERARSPPAGHLHKDKRLCIREQAEDKNRKNRLEISEDSKATNLLAMGKGSESHKEMYGPQKASSGKQKSSFSNKPGLFKPYARSHSVEQSVEQSLKKKVKASVAHISRILKGKISPEPETEEDFGELGSEAVEKELLTGAEGSLKRKSALSSFKLPSLMPKEKAPSFVEELIDQAAAVGQCVTLSCRTAAHTSPHIDWFRDGIPVRSSSRILISGTLKNFQLLTILSVSADDFGIYTCVATNSLGSASTSCIIRKAEVPPSPPPPDIVEVYEDGVQVVWKPVETNIPVHYTVQCKSEDGEWITLTSDIADCCYYAKNLSKGFIYCFRIACTSKAGMGPYSDPSAKVKITAKDQMELRAAMQNFPSEEESEIITPSEPFPTYHTYAFQTEIKRGRFSIVRQCREKLSGKTLAAKIIPYWQEDKQTVLLEYQVLRKLHHTNIAQLKGAYVSPRHLVLIQEMCVGPELLHSLALRTSYSEVEVRDYLWQILSAVEYLHAHSILHLDLRSENMIITEPNLLKLLDFGNAQFYTQDKVITMEKCMDYVETMAPELLTEQGALPQTDIWSIGITAFIMLSASYPVSSDVACEFLRMTRKGKVKLTRCYAGLSGGAVSFLQSTLCANPWGRPSALECLQSPWLQETGLDNRQQALVTFPTTKLRNFLTEREKKRGLLCSKYGLMIAQ